eukprot:scaffold672_cov126-Cylindrotheca_fusiformis.AAC.36
MNNRTITNNCPFVYLSSSVNHQIRLLIVLYTAAALSTTNSRDDYPFVQPVIIAVPTFAPGKYDHKAMFPDVAVRTAGRRREFFLSTAHFDPVYYDRGKRQGLFWHNGLLCCLRRLFQDPN